MRIHIRDEEGQSTVEFALTIILLMSFVFLFLQLSLVFGFGNYAHYATFMSARAYLSAGHSYDDQVSRAKSVIINTLKAGDAQAGRDRFPMIAQGVGGDVLAGFAVNSSGNKSFPVPSNGDRSSSWLQGVRYTFSSKLFLIPLGTGKSTSATTNGASANKLTLTSESFLGREPPDDECQTQLGKVSGLYDNGC
jgi:Flp pilus assembly protein TadG